MATPRLPAHARRVVLMGAPGQPKMLAMPWERIGWLWTGFHDDGKPPAFTLEQIIWSDVRATAGGNPVNR